MASEHYLLDEKEKPACCYRPVPFWAFTGAVVVLVLALGVPLAIVSRDKDDSSDDSGTSCPSLPAEDAAVESRNHGKITVFDDKFYNFVDRSSTMELLSLAPFTYTWMEAPLWDEATRSVLFADPGTGNTIYSWNNRTGVKTSLRPAGYTGDLANAGGFGFPGPNGQIFNSDGKHILCQQGNARIAEVTPLRSFEPIAETFEGKQFWGPNDVVQDSFGWYWITDPNFRSPGSIDPNRVNATGVYAAKNGTVLQLITDVLNPNGIAFFPGENSLVITETGNITATAKARAWKFTVQRTGPDATPSVSNKQLFFDGSPYRARGWMGGGDGMKIDSSGNAWMSMPGGILCVDQTGTLLARLDLEAQATNVWIADKLPHPVMYITAANPPTLIRLTLKKA